MRRLLLLFGLIMFSVGILSAQTAKEKQKIISKSNVKFLKDFAKQKKLEAKANKEKAIKIAKEKGHPIIFTDDDGSFNSLMRVTDDGDFIYYKTYNVDAAKTTRTDFLYNGGGLGLNLEGQGMTTFIWDGGHGRVTHQEYDGDGGDNRLTIMDPLDPDAGLHFHAAHVTGTMIASGFVPDAKGMAPQAYCKGYEWNNDVSEATTEAADNAMLVSNHSYGYNTEFINTDWVFGAYDSESRAWDIVMNNAPYYLMVNAAGNDGDEDGYNSVPLDGNSAYDKLCGHSTSKNVLVVANAQDATIDGGELTSVTINSSSSEGPTDDYRIKPDITGNGTLLYSTFETSDNAYESITGTSMASPNVTGTLLLLQQHYNNLHPEEYMLAATLKGLVLHTADDAGPTGPDAVYGWGLLNAKKAAETISNDGNNTIISELTLNNGGSYYIDVVANGQEDLLASMSWNDPAGTANTGTANDDTPVLVNDLDIRITESTNTYYPWRLTSITTNSNAGDNFVDPYERVDVASPTCGTTYRITVTHKGTLASSQDYTLIVTGVKSATTDAGIVSVAPQGSSCDYSNNTPIDIEVANFGNTTLNNVLVTYEVRKSDNSLVGNGSYTISSIAACSSDISTVYADMSVNGEVYTIDLTISVAGDENSSNNTYSGSFGAVNVDLSTPGDSYSTGFEAGSLEEIGWSQQDVNGDGGQAVWYIYQDAGFAHTGTGFAIQFAGAGDLQSDDWLFSPCLYLKAGQDYEADFWAQQILDKGETIGLYIGSSPDAASMSTTLTSPFNPSAGSWAQHNSGTFTVPSDGVYYLGWHSYNMTDAYAPAIDDVTISNTSTPVLPQVTTGSISNITGTSADGSGEVTAAGTSTVTERGIVYSTDINPTTLDNKVADGSGGTGVFTGLTMTPLASSTTYYVRAYAINSSGTSYGENVSFTTLSGPPVISGVDIDNFYKDKGSIVTISGSDMGSATSVGIGGTMGSINSNSASQIVVNFPAGVYANNTLTVTTPSGSGTYTMNLQTRNIIPVGGGFDYHTSIQSALDGLFAWYGSTAFSAGDNPGAKTIDVYSGTYNEMAVPNVSLNTSSGNGLTIQNHSGESPVISATGNDHGFYMGALDYVTISGFSVYGATLDNIYTEGDNNEIQFNKCYNSVAGSGIKLSASNSATVKNNLVYSNYDYGIHLVGCTTVETDNNTGYDNGHNIPLQTDITIKTEGFESGAASGWSLGFWSVVAQSPNTGTYALRLSGGGASSTATSAVYDISGYQSVNVSFWAFRNTQQTCNLTVEYNLDGTGWIELLPATNVNKTTYAQYPTTAGPGISGNSLQLRFSGAIASGGGTRQMFIDDIEIIGTIPASNAGAGLYVESGTGTSVENNIFVAKSGTDYVAMKTESGITVTSDYNTYFKNGNTNLVDYNGSTYADLAAWNTNGAGTNELEGDPLFVNAGTDFHIQSTNNSYVGGTWPPSTEQGGTWDNASQGDSPALDAGNPADSYNNEPQAGGLINQGCYGNTAQASKSAQLDLIWTGASSSDWQTEANWYKNGDPSFNAIPSLGDNATIPDLSAETPENYPIVDDGELTAYCNDLSVAAYNTTNNTGNTPSVTIATNGQMTVGGSVTNPTVDGIIVQSDASGDGSLIVNDATVEATVQRYMTGGVWNYFCSPISSTSTGLFSASLMAYDESKDDYWTPSLYEFSGTSGSGWVVTPVSIDVTKGYLYQNTSNETINYEGTLNYSATTDVSVGYNPHSGTAANGVAYTVFDGWELVGNKYTSALDWLEITKTNVGSDVCYYNGTQYVYFRDNGDGTTSSNGGSQFIPAQQAFFVKSASGGGTLTIPASARTHNNTAFWKNNKETNENTVKLTVEANGETDALIIKQLAGASPSYDFADGLKMFAYDSNVPQVFSMGTEGQSEGQFWFNAIPEISETIQYPIGLKLQNETNFTLSVDALNFPGIDYLYLYDTETDEYYELDNYFTKSFVQNVNAEGVDYERFMLYFGINQAPNILNDIIDVETPEDELFTLNVNNVFEDNDIMDSFTPDANLDDGTQLPAWLSFNPETMIFEGIPGNYDVGLYNIELTATDTYGARASVNFTITVGNTNDAPIINIPLEDWVAEAETISNYTFAADAFVDIDREDQLSYSYEVLPFGDYNWINYHPDTRTFTAEPTAANIGTYTIAVTAADLAGSNVTDDFVLNVTSALSVGQYPERKLVLYPNPTNSEFYVGIKGYKGEYLLRVHSLGGQLLYYNTNKAGSFIKVSLNNLASGIYFVEIITEDGFVSRQKLIIE